MGKNTKSISPEITKSTGPQETGIKSITSMYPIYYEELDNELCSIIREKFLESRVKDLKDNLRTSNINAMDITNFMQDLYGNYYFLFGINSEDLKDELMRDEDLRRKVEIMLKGDLP